MSTVQVLLATGLMLGLALVVELMTRLILRRRDRSYVHEPDSRLVLEIDTETLPGLDHEVRIEANSDGERGDPLQPDWRSTYRVLVAGGSAAECHLLDQSSTWPAVLQRELGRCAASLGAEHVHVGSIARSLVRCESIEAMLWATLPRMPRLDLVVLMVGASDVVAWLEQGCPSEYSPNAPSPDECFAQHDRGPWGWHPRRTALREIIKRVHRRVARPIGRKANVGRRIGENRAMRARAKFWIDETPDTAPLVASFREGFGGMVEAASSTGARVLIVRQPWLETTFTPEEEARLWNFGIGRPYEETVTTYYALPVVHELLRVIDAETGRLATELGLGQIELQSRLQHGFETFYDSLHFTPEGARAVGVIVAERVLEGTVAPERDRRSAA